MNEKEDEDGAERLKTFNFENCSTFGPFSNDLSLSTFCHNLGLKRNMFCGEEGTKDRYMCTMMRHASILSHLFPHVFHILNLGLNHF
jgi:hypothetical protein